MAGGDGAAEQISFAKVGNQVAERKWQRRTIGHHVGHPDAGSGGSEGHGFKHAMMTLDRARPGDTVEIPYGIYHERVVIDLSVTATSPRAATLRWTAPGDDGHAGTAAGYELRRSTGQISVANWSLADPVPCSLVPRVAGTPETLRVSDLVPRSEVYFALRSHDEVGNQSAVSQENVSGA